MKRISQTILLLFVSVFANAQVVDDSQKPDLFLETQVSNNILLYRLLVNYPQLKSGEFSENGFLKPQSGLMYYLPPSGGKLKLEFMRSSINFPDTSFILYEVIKEGDIYDLDSILLESEIPPVHNDKRFLVAYDPASEQVLFLSGNFFLSHYSRFFKSNDPMEALNYLRLRLFYLDNFKNITYLKEKKRKFLFRVYLGNSMVIVKVKKNDLNNLKMSKQKVS